MNIQYYVFPVVNPYFIQFTDFDITELSDELYYSKIRDNFLGIKQLKKRVTYKKNRMVHFVRVLFGV